ncbi:MAG: extracellular solute-binding protein [Clostridia bacterium]|nr:extracellular solute-binding protein [Clostridia bacterium]
MRKMLVMMISLCLMLMICAGALAAGVTIRTFTPFADVDFAAQGYMDMITAWEAETGNVVEDYSGAMDESWMAALRAMLESGEADVVVLPVGSGLTVNELVSAPELAAAAPDIGAKKFSAMKESDSSMLLAPVRLYFEALYVNTDVLSRYGLAVPETFEQLLTACMILRSNGVLPIANALCEWSEIVLDCAALSGAPADQYGRQVSLDGAKDVLATLAQVGAFGSDPWNMTDMDAESKFLSGEAAMRIDADILAQLIAPERADQVIVVNLPAKDGQARNEVVGAPAFGVAISRACWQDESRKQAAISFVKALLAERSIVTAAAGKLGESIAALTRNAQDMTGLLYDMNPDTFDSWAEDVIAQLMSL